MQFVYSLWSAFYFWSNAFLLKKNFNLTFRLADKNTSSLQHSIAHENVSDVNQAAITFSHICRRPSWRLVHTVGVCKHDGCLTDQLRLLHMCFHKGSASAAGCCSQCSCLSTMIQWEKRNINRHLMIFFFMFVAYSANIDIDIIPVFHCSFNTTIRRSFSASGLFLLTTLSLLLSVQFLCDSECVRSLLFKSLNT